MWRLFKNSISFTSSQAESPRSRIDLNNVKTVIKKSQYSRGNRTMTTNQTSPMENRLYSCR